MSKYAPRSYLDEIRSKTAGGKVTVYRNREWIIQALREGVQKRVIYDTLVEHEGLKITYQQFAKLTTKLLAELGGGTQQKSAHQVPQRESGSKPHKPDQPQETGTKKFEHNPFPNEEELF